MKATDAMICPCNVGTTYQIIPEAEKMYDGSWLIYCPECYDGAPDAGPQMLASGATLTEATLEWNEKVLDLCDEME